MAAKTTRETTAPRATKKKATDEENGPAPADLGEQQSQSARGALELARAAWKHGCSLDMLAQIASVNVEDLTLRRDKTEPPLAARLQAETALRLLDALADRGLEPVSWLDQLIVDGVPVRRKALEYDSVLALADGTLEPTDAMDQVRADWRDAWNVPAPKKRTARTRTTAQAKTSPKADKAAGRGR